MNSRTRLIILVSAVLIVYVAAFNLMARVSISRTYARADSEDVQRQVVRAHWFLSSSLDTLQGTCSDWAYWDDTYEYASGRNPEYVESNLGPGSLATIGVDTMVLLDLSGKPIYVGPSQTGNQPFDGVSQDIITQFGIGTALLKRALAYPGVSGYMLVGGQTALVVAQPVLTSARMGPERGLLIFVRRLDQTFYSTMAATIGGSVTLQPIGRVQPATIESQALALLAEGQATVGLRTGTDEMRGFERLTDISGNNAFLLATTSVHTHSNQIVQLERTAILFTSIAGIVFSIVGVVLLNRFLLRRIASLGHQVADIGNTSDLSLRVNLPGSDELSQLAGDVNTTLESLQQTQRDKDEMAAQLAQDRQRLRDYFDYAHDLIFSLDTENKITMVNRSVYSTLGYDENDLLGHSFLDVLSPESRESAFKANEEIRSGNTVPTTTVDVLTRSGDRRTLDLNGQRLWENGQVAGTFYIARDITDRLRMEQEMLHSEALESLGTLAAGIAHDFNNVLTVVKGNISLADSALKEPTDTRQHLEVASAAVDRAQALASQLLTFSRGGAPVTENVDVESIVRQVAKFALSGSNVALDVHVDGSLPAVEADRNQLFQVIQNVILNARDAMPSGGALRINLRRQTISEEHPVGFATSGDCVIIEMADTGPGIPPDIMQRVFSPFFSTKTSGHGVGLATARSIARRHGGDLLIESTVGKGTTVLLCLPAAQGPSTQVQPVRLEGKPGLAPGRLLIMDDEQTVADVTCAMARRLGYEPTAVPDGETALTAYTQAVVDQRPFDLVIMDLTVPGGMGGREAVQRLLELYPDARVIVASGYSDDASIAEYKQVGFIASLPKPYTMQDLERVLREASTPPITS